MMKTMGIEGLMDSREMRLVILIALTWLVFGAGSCAQMGRPTSGTSSASVDLLDTGLVGWEQIGGPAGAWRFEDGLLTCEAKGGNWLSTVRPYSDFELSVEFRVASGSNSGVFLRAPHEGDPAYTGMEIQILDDYAPQHAELKPNQFTGSIYDVAAPSERVSRKAGEWQSMILTCRGTLVTVDLNGRTVVDTNLSYFPYKYESHPGLARDRGYIGLQDHGSRVQFRNIRIRVLNK
jgi:hypothetical protein